jgi:hypothetical protein
VVSDEADADDCDSGVAFGYGAGSLDCAAFAAVVATFSLSHFAADGVS